MRSSDLPSCAAISASDAPSFHLRQRERSFALIEPLFERVRGLSPFSRPPFPEKGSIEDEDEGEERGGDGGENGTIVRLVEEGGRVGESLIAQTILQFENG